MIARLLPRLTRTTPIKTIKAVKPTSISTVLPRYTSTMTSLQHNIQGSPPLLSETVKSNRTLSDVMTAMHHIAPLTLADTSWDNVGLLLEAPKPRLGRGVHLCIDLTTSVTEEALSNPETSVIICYHPIIFRGLKSLTLANSQQASLLRLISSGISVYSPHTSLDATIGGINDWLALVCAAGSHDGFESHPAPCNGKSDKNAPKGFEAAGMGREFSLKQGISTTELVSRLKKGLHLDHVQIATPSQGINDDIKSIAVCAGSGSSVLADTNTDVWVTGEMSHHEVLAAVASGKTVILTNHTNTERGYLSDVLKPWLENISQGLQITVSQSDRDPLQVA
ncbi:unnamed protein product [Sympodiomycopsis kandeliae]